QSAALRRAEHAGGRIGDGAAGVPAAEPLEPLRRVPRAEAGVVEIAEPRRLPSGRRGDATDQIHRAETLGEVPPHHLGRSARDLEGLAAFRVPANAHRPGPDAGLPEAVPDYPRP